MRKAVTIALVALLSVSTPQLASADSIRDRQYWLDQFGFSVAWESSQGEGVKVAVIDTGIDATHPSLRGTVVGGTDVSGIGTRDGLTPVGKSSYHGTMVASILAGRGSFDDKSSGVIGTAPKAEILSVSMAFGVPGLDTDSQIAEGIIWAVDNGATVINLSLTRNSTSWPESWDKAFSYAFENDVVIVAAVGNRADGTEQVSAPASIPGVIAVAGVDRELNPSALSSVKGFTIGVTAPSEDLVASYPGGGYRLWSGTSAAAPIVSGLVAMIRSMYPEMNAVNVVNRVIQSATKLGFEGYSNNYGHGIIDAENALLAQIPEVTENPLGSLTRWIELYRPSEPREASPGEIVTPIAAPELEPIKPLPWYASSSVWFSVAGYAGLGLLAIFLYFAFRPQSHSPTQTKRK